MSILNCVNNLAFVLAAPEPYLFVVSGGKNYFGVYKIDIEDLVHRLVDLLAFGGIHVPVADCFVVTA
jgi:hypothetical protein